MKRSLAGLETGFAFDGSVRVFARMNAGEVSLPTVATVGACVSFHAAESESECSTPSFPTPKDGVYDISGHCVGRED